MEAAVISSCDISVAEARGSVEIKINWNCYSWIEVSSKLDLHNFCDAWIFSSKWITKRTKIDPCVKPCPARSTQWPYSLEVSLMTQVLAPSWDHENTWSWDAALISTAWSPHPSCPPHSGPQHHLYSHRKKGVYISIHAHLPNPTPTLVSLMSLTLNNQLKAGRKIFPTKI